MTPVRRGRKTEAALAMTILLTVTALTGVSLAAPSKDDIRDA